MKLISRAGKFLYLMIIFPAIALLNSIAFAEPEGQLYWETDENPGVYSLYDSGETYKGAVAILDYDCQQDYGSNYEYFQIDGSANNYPAKKGGYCYYHTLVGPMPGNYYTAYLYCNEVKREMFDDSVCEPSGPVFTPEKNFGPPPTCSQ